MSYTFENHLHNYACWTAARAVQRNFTITKNIVKTIEATDLICLISTEEKKPISSFVYQVTIQSTVETQITDEVNYNIPSKYFFSQRSETQKPS